MSAFYYFCKRSSHLCFPTCDVFLTSPPQPPSTFTIYSLSLAFSNLTRLYQGAFLLIFIKTFLNDKFMFFKQFGIFSPLYYSISHNLSLTLLEFQLQVFWTGVYPLVPEILFIFLYNLLCP